MKTQYDLDQLRISALRNEAKRIEEDSLYSSKSHFNVENSWESRNYWLGVPATLLAAVAGAALIKSHPDLASIFAMTASLLTGLMTFLKPNERAAVHRAAAGKYLALRNDTRCFRQIELLQEDRLSEQTEILRTLSERRNELNQSSPRIPRWAFVAARKGVEEGEASYKVDQED